MMKNMKNAELIEELTAQRDDANEMGYGYYAEAFNKAINALKEMEYEIYEWKIPLMRFEEQQEEKPEGYDDWRQQ